ncbi:MAG: XisI protein [Spirochaetota bacterium]
MEELAKYHTIISEILAEEAKGSFSNSPHVEQLLSIDRENGHYFLFMLGWDGTERVHSCLFHLDIRNDKIWIQQNNTDFEIAEELLRRGVSKDDIVLALHHPKKWQYTDYGTDLEFQNKILQK